MSKQYNDDANCCSRAGAIVCLQIDGTVCLKKRHPYFWQVLGQMACCCVNWCAFAVLSGGELFVEKVSVDNAAWDRAISLLRHFYFEHNAPELG